MTDPFIEDIPGITEDMTRQWNNWYQRSWQDYQRLIHPSYGLSSGSRSAFYPVAGQVPLDEAAWRAAGFTEELNLTQKTVNRMQNLAFATMREGVKPAAWVGNLWAGAQGPEQTIQQLADYQERIITKSVIPYEGMTRRLGNAIAQGHLAARVQAGDFYHHLGRGAARIYFVPDTSAVQYALDKIDIEVYKTLFSPSMFRQLETLAGKILWEVFDEAFMQQTKETGGWPDAYTNLIRQFLPYNPGDAKQKGAFRIHVNVAGKAIYVELNLDKLGSQTQLEQGYHFGAILKGAYTKSGKRTRTSRVTSLGRVYKDSDFQYPVNSRYKFFKNSVLKNQWQLSLLREQSRLGKSPRMRLSADSPQMAGLYELTIAARVAFWEDLGVAPVWLFLQYGTNWAPKVNKFDIVTKFNARFQAVFMQFLADILNQIFESAGAGFAFDPRVRGFRRGTYEPRASTNEASSTKIGNLEPRESVIDFDKQGRLRIWNPPNTSKRSTIITKRSNKRKAAPDMGEYGIPDNFRYGGAGKITKIDKAELENIIDRYNIRFMSDTAAGRGPGRDSWKSPKVVYYGGRGITLVRSTAQMNQALEYGAIPYVRVKVWVKGKPKILRATTYAQLRRYTATKANGGMGGTIVSGHGKSRKRNDPTRNLRSTYQAADGSTFEVIHRVRTLDARTYKARKITARRAAAARRASRAASLARQGVTKEVLFERLRAGMLRVADQKRRANARVYAARHPREKVYVSKDGKVIRRIVQRGDSRVKEWAKKYPHGKTDSGKRRRRPLRTVQRPADVGGGYAPVTNPRFLVTRRRASEGQAISPRSVTKLGGSRRARKIQRALEKPDTIVRVKLTPEEPLTKKATSIMGKYKTIRERDILIKQTLESGLYPMIYVPGQGFYAYMTNKIYGSLVHARMRGRRRALRRQARPQPTKATYTFERVELSNLDRAIARSIETGTPYRLPWNAAVRSSIASMRGVGISELERELRRQASRQPGGVFRVIGWKHVFVRPTPSNPIGDIDEAFRVVASKSKVLVTYWDIDAKAWKTVSQSAFSSRLTPEQIERLNLARIAEQRQLAARSRRIQAEINKKFGRVGSRYEAGMEQARREVNEAVEKFESNPAVVERQQDLSRRRIIRRARNLSEQPVRVKRGSRRSSKGSK